MKGLTKMGETTIYLMQGTVNVIKATLTKE